MSELSLESILNCRCLIGVNYVAVDGGLLEQRMLAGTVSAVDKEVGITFTLIGSVDAGRANTAQFTIPSDLRCWFTAPKGEYGTTISEEKLRDPDYLVTWDVHQTKTQKPDGEHQWWKWVARTESPFVKGASVE